MMKKLQLGKVTVEWLGGGGFRLDGGSMFGPVPKVLWQKRYPADAQNTIAMVNDPLLVRTPTCNVIIDSGLGNKLTEKQKEIYKVDPPWDVPEGLMGAGLSPEDIDYVILTHGDFDHAGGITMVDSAGNLRLTFPQARHVLHRFEWEDICNPCLRAQSTYLKENFQLLREGANLVLTESEFKVCPEINVIHTGGHTRGHQIVEIHSDGQTAMHLGDLLPTHVHVNPLWVMAYDNFPLTVIEKKIEFLNRCEADNIWITSYHDPEIRAFRLGPDRVVVEHFSA